MAEQNSQMDKVIDGALKQLEAEAVEGIRDVETSWANFEKALKEKQSKQNKQSYIKLALVVSLALVLLMSTQSEKVIAFKNEVFQWIGKDDQGIIISEVENPAIEPGTYEGLSFEEVQEKVVFHLLSPEFLPEGIHPEPKVEMEVYDYPILQVKMEFFGDPQTILIFSQEKTSGNMQKNTYIPENVEYEEVCINDEDVIVISADETVSAQWNKNGIYYDISTFGVKEEDVKRVIENLK